MSSSTKIPPVGEKELREMQRNLDQVMGALAEIRLLLKSNAAIGRSITYDVHMTSGISNLRVPHMARADCGCGGEHAHGIAGEVEGKGIGAREGRVR